MGFTKRDPGYVEFRLPTTGNTVTDTNDFIAAVDAMPARGGTIWVKDNGNALALSSDVATHKNITKPIFIRGETPNARIENNGATSFVINFGNYEAPAAATPNTLAAPSNNSIGVHAFSGINQFESKLQCDSLSISTGDWLCLMADDPITGVVDHNPGSETRPMEIHKVTYVDGSDVYLSGHVKDAMTINPRLQIMSMIRGCGMADLQLSSNILTAGTSARSTGIRADKVLQARFENIEVDETGFGSLFVVRGADISVNNFSGRSQPNPFIDYAVVAGIVNGFTFRDSWWNECRHVFTTGAYEITGGHRYGGTIGCTVYGVTANIGGDQYDNKFAVFDSHPEGSDIEFNQCEVFSGSTNEINGFNLRARRNRLVNCKVHGGDYRTSDPENVDKGVKISSENNEIIGCHFERLWQGVVMVDTATADNLWVTDCEFINCSSVGIRSVAATDNINVKGCRFRNSGWYDNAGSPDIKKVLIEVTGGTGHVFRGNCMDKENNDYTFHFDNLTSSDMTIQGNYAMGYGVGELGIRGAADDPNAYTNTTGESINAAFVGENYTD